MKKIKIYLDTCTFNRPFDDQIKLEIKFEAEAKIHIQEKIKHGELALIWSYVLEYENANNPFPMRKYTILQWKKIAEYYIFENDQIINRSNEFIKMGLKSKDALHISCAIASEANYFITTDKKILKKLKYSKEITAINPVSFLLALEELNENRQRN